MVSPSATPITLPDHAQAGQGSTRKKITARYKTEEMRLDIDLSTLKTRIILARVPPPAEHTDFTARHDKNNRSLSGNIA